MKKLRKISMLLLLLLTAGTLLCGFDSEEQKVYDDADLLTEEEEAELQELLVETAHRIEQDLIIVCLLYTSVSRLYCNHKKQTRHSQRFEQSI